MFTSSTSCVVRTRTTTPAEHARRTSNDSAGARVGGAAATARMGLRANQRMEVNRHAKHRVGPRAQDVCVRDAVPRLVRANELVARAQLYALEEGVRVVEGELSGDARETLQVEVTCACACACVLTLQVEVTYA
jgi:hypothetical protein